VSKPLLTQNGLWVCPVLKPTTRDVDVVSSAAGPKRRSRNVCSHRTVVSIWRIYFHPPREHRGTTWNSGKKNPSKLTTEPPRDGHVRRRRRVIA
jgi:hypothetical protein